MVRGMRNVERAMGNGRKVPNASELAIAAVARKSLHFRNALTRGQTLKADDVVALRPGTGVPPSRLHEFVGRRLQRDAVAGARLEELDLEPIG